MWDNQGTEYSGANTNTMPPDPARLYSESGSVAFGSTDRMALIESRFWAKVARGPVDECWPWTGARTAGGYGKMGVDGRSVPATHVSLILAGRPLAAGEKARHTCDNPPCVNPAHLIAGDQKQNMGDAVARGRTARGEGHGRGRLIEADVVALREMRASGGLLKDVGARFGVSEAAVSVIARGIKWPTAPGPISEKDPRWTR
jgi:hypothetical protein